MNWLNLTSHGLLIMKFLNYLYKFSDQIYCPLSAYNPPQNQQSCATSDSIHLKQTLLKELETTSSIFEEVKT